MSKEQLSVLILERSKPEHSKMSWDNLSEILNAKGPSIKNAQAWKNVNIKMTMFLVIMF